MSDWYDEAVNRNTVKEDEKQPITGLKVDKELKRWLKEKAKDARMSVTGLVEKILEEWKEKRQEKKQGRAGEPKTSSSRPATKTS